MSVKHFVQGRMTYPRIPVFSAILMSAIAATVAHSGAKPLRDAQLVDVVTDTRFIAFRGALRAEVEFSGKGQVRFESEVGSFDGTWSAAVDTVCVFFDDGPLSPELCFGLNEEAQSLTTTEGTLLVPVMKLEPQT